MRTVKLAELAADKRWAINGGPFGSKLVSKDYRDEGVPVIRGTNLPDSSWFSDDNLVFVSEEKADELLANNAHPGDVIFTQRGTLGQVGLIPLDSPFERYVISQSQMKMTVDRSVADPRWLYYYFRQESIVESIKARAVTSGVPHINLGTLKDFDIALPDLKTQEATADCLTALDILLENNLKQVRLLEEAARLIYTEWFVRHRAPGCKPQETGLLPNGWRRDRLDSVMTLQRGFDLPAEERVDGDTPIIASTGICGTHSTHKVTGPGVVTGRSGTLGKVHLIQQDFWPLNTTLWVKEYRGISPYFAYFLLQMLNLASLNVGASVPSLDRNTVHPLPVVIPSEALLAKFDETVIPIFQQIATLEKQIAATKQARDLLLPRLISGQLRL